MLIPGAEGKIDESTFEQILEMDDDEEERDFSKSIVYDFFGQAESTFDKMKTNLKSENLHELSELGHFLKGSSATLGLTLVKDECEKIQNFGAKTDATGGKISEADAIEGLKKSIDKAQVAFRDVEKVLRKFYGE